MTIHFRPATLDDRPFIVSGWSASYRLSRDCIVPMEFYADVMHRVVAHYLDRPGVETIVAHGSVLQGFICAEPPDCVLYVYVAQPFRRVGLARALFAQVGIDPAGRFSYAARTRASWECRAKIPMANYDPMRVRFEPGDRQ